MLGTGSFILLGVAVAAPEQKKLKNDSKLPIPEEEVVYADEMKPFDPFVKQVPVDQLPISSEYSNESSLDGGVSTMATTNRCYGTGVKFLDVQVNSNGSIKGPVGTFGLVADSIVTKPGQARRSGHVTVAIPGLPGVIQEFSTSWIVRWSGSTVKRVRVQATLRAWDLGRGWNKVASLDKVIID